eukprot:4299607-Amphidinium_carterae.1
MTSAASSSRRALTRAWNTTRSRVNQPAALNAAFPIVMEVHSNGLAGIEVKEDSSTCACSHSPS